MLVGIVGFAGSGKGTVGEFLVKNHNFRTDSFAASLKDATAMIFGWDRDMLEGDTRESRFKREQADRFWSKRLGIKNFTPREAMQKLGTEGCRRVFNEDIWVATVERRWINSGKVPTVITDCRFPNEIDMIRDNDGVVLRVKRGPEPDFYQLMTFFNKGMCDDEDNKIIKTRKASGLIPHESETAWIGYDVDEMIVNDDDLGELETRVRELVERFTDADTQYSLLI